MSAIFVALLNALASLLPQLPGFIAEVRSSSSLSDGAKALLEQLDSKLAADEKAVDAVAPLPVDDPKP